MIYSDQFTDRLTIVISRIGSIAETARKLSVAESTVRKWRDGGSDPQRKHLINLAKYGDVSLAWLVSGEGDMKPSQGVSEKIAEYNIGSEFDYVPQYDIEVSAGSGKFEQQSDIVGKLAFSRKWLKNKGLNVTDLVIVRAIGDSMVPTIRDNSLLLVETRQEKFTGDGIYVIIHDGTIIAKRLQRDLNTGGLLILSDNPAYQPIKLTQKEAEDIYIIGKVIWSGGEI
ncbi:MAG TPA: helix-turn-helix transcriptional regulator [Gammaproteobacteria bacterium]|nr:helix-turn-helix transcriptional regulator [Gammaproteobacteria bacterium]